MTILNIVLLMVICTLSGIIIGMVCMYIRLNWGKFKDNKQ